MHTSRLELRLDQERRRKLTEIATARGAPVSQVIREMIDQIYEEARRADRLRAAQELARLEVEDVPDEATLNRQLESTYASTDLP